MANTSNWKGSERAAAALFPGGRRRTRVGGTYALVADDVVWGDEYRHGNRVVKHGGALPGCPPIYIEVKKHARSALASEYWRTWDKYACNSNDQLVLVTHVKRARRLLVTITGEMFSRLLRDSMAAAQGGER